VHGDLINMVEVHVHVSSFVGGGGSHAP
jgi:hypothetical protein